MSHLPHRPLLRRWWPLTMLGALLLLAPLPASAQVRPAAPTSQAATLTLDEAIQIAVVTNQAFRSTQLDVATASSQVKEGWGELLPQIDLSSSYTRTVRSVNPFAGSQAGGFFSTLGFIDWLAFNEQARTDDDVATDPISVAEFFERQQAGLAAAGVPPATGGGNPFEVPNQFNNTLTITQKLFDGRAIWGASGAQRHLVPFNQAGADRQEQLLIGQVKQAFFAALLAQEQARVVNQRVRRTRSTQDEVAKQVAQGMVPKFQRLTTEVELANLETQLSQAQNQASLATDDLKLLLGVPVEQDIQLRGALEAEDRGQYLTIALENATDLAIQQRPDLEQARLNLELQRVQRQAARAEFLPEMSAFANISFIGNVPSNRLSVLTNPDDPFSFTTQNNGFFSSSYWDWDVRVGFRLNWNLFNGFRSRQRMQQRQIAIQQAELQQEQLLHAVRVEIDRALRNLQDAESRIANQELNVQRAELNYEYAQTRLREGVATPQEERDASDLLDQSRLNYVQAIFDYLVAKSTFETAVGMPYAPADAARLTSN